MRNVDAMRFFSYNAKTSVWCLLWSLWAEVNKRLHKLSDVCDLNMKKGAALAQELRDMFMHALMLKKVHVELAIALWQAFWRADESVFMKLALIE